MKLDISGIYDFIPRDKILSLSGEASRAMKMLHEGNGPGNDLVIGTVDDTSTGERDNCNFSDVAYCATAGSPTIGSFSFVKMDLVMPKSCMTGDNAGGSCVVDGDCPGCTSPFCCVDCDDVSYSYLGDVGVAVGNGTYKTCQEDGSTFDYTALNIGTESIQMRAGNRNSRARCHRSGSPTTSPLARLPEYR